MVRFPPRIRFLESIFKLFKLLVGKSQALTLNIFDIIKNEFGTILIASFTNNSLWISWGVLFGRHTVVYNYSKSFHVWYFKVYQINRKERPSHPIISFIFTKYVTVLSSCQWCQNNVLSVTHKIGINFGNTL